MLTVSEISVMYGAHRALEDAAVRVDAGEIVVILGANGAGKSSLLKAIAGTCEGRVEGKVELNGESLSNLPAEVIVVRGIAFVPEGRGIFGDLTVHDNLTLGAHAKEARAHQDKNLARVYELFPKLRERTNQTARTMSGGEQQMVAIGRAIMANPKILMLDEPSLGLSPLLCKELFQNLSLIRDAGIGVLMVEQNAKQSLAISDRAYLLENGTITSENSAKAMMNDPAVQAAYLGGAKSTAGPAKIKIITPLNDEEAPTNLAGEAVASAQRYIQPFEGTHELGTRNQISGIDINSLVGRASDLAESGVALSKVPAQSRSQPDVSDPVAQSNIAGIGISAGDPDVKTLLANFESAALSMRSSNQRVNEGDDRRTAATSSTIHDDERLPKIPIYRRSKLEVYRRTPAGDLLKVEER